MGVTFSSLSSWMASLMFWARQEELKIMMLGLDSAGKTTILYRLKLNSYIHTVPTVSFNVEEVQYKSLHLLIWDLGGQASTRSYWHCFSDETKAIVYVVDSADKARLGLTKRELHSLLDADELQNAKLLVLANKQDLAGAASPAEVSDALALDSLRDRSWTIIPTVATEGKGIEEGMDWLVNAIQTQS